MDDDEILRGWVVSPHHTGRAYGFVHLLRGDVRAKKLGDVFYHATGVLTDRPLRRGDRVRFNLVSCCKGHRAEAVELDLE